MSWASASRSQMTIMLVAAGNLPPDAEEEWRCRVTASARDARAAE